MRPLAIALVLCLATLGAEPASQPVLAKQCDELAVKWHAALDEAGMTAVIAPPFVIAGDASRARLAGYRDRTILAAADALQAQYFSKQPTEPTLILLFETRQPYERFAKTHFGDADPPHYGYYRHRDNVMLMNVGTGTGTLVHELTHALIKPDFPAAPGWFNEGFASLFEQCTIDNQRIRGLTNWRLTGLQRAIRQDALRPLAEMINDRDFYGEAHVGINYAQARYLMLYLQEHDLLDRYYRTFRDNAAHDPTGSQSLQRVLGIDSLAEFDPAWQRWVLQLRFEP